MSKVTRESPKLERMRAEISELLRLSAVAGTKEDLAFSVARSICNLSNARSVCIAAFLEGTEGQCSVTFGAFGHSEFLAKREAENPLHESQTLDAFMSFVEEFDIEGLGTGFTIENGNGSIFYCRKVQDHFNLFSGFIGIESEFDPFDSEVLDDWLLALTVVCFRFAQPAASRGTQSVAMKRIIHDVNGLLAIIGLQTEILRTTENLGKQSPDAMNRISATLERIDLTMRRFDEFSQLFFADTQNATNHRMSSSPAIALRVAIESLNIPRDQIGRIDLDISVSDDVEVGVEGIVLYWIYGSFISAWLNPRLWGATERFKFSVDLRLNGSDPQEVELALSRSFGLEIDQFLDAARNNPVGYLNDKVVIMTPQTLMKELVTLFDGISSIETLNGVRTATIRFPRM
jgi:hypothetical protein